MAVDSNIAFIRVITSNRLIEIEYLELDLITAKDIFFEPPLIFLHAPMGNGNKEMDDGIDSVSFKLVTHRKGPQEDLRLN